MATFPPMRGVFDMSKTPTAIITTVNQVLYVLTMIKYGDGQDEGNTEFVFTCYTDGKMLNKSNNFVESLAVVFGINSDQSYFGPKTATKIKLPSGTVLDINYIEPVAVTWNGKAFIFNSLNNGIISLRINTFTDSATPPNKYTSVLAVEEGSGTNFIIQPFQTNNIYFNQNPNFFAGFPYTLTYDGNSSNEFSFRFFQPFNSSLPDNSWKQPSTCTKGGGAGTVLDPPYLCNLDTQGTNSANISYFLSNLDNATDPTAVINSTLSLYNTVPIFLTPINFYQANFQNTGSIIDAPSRSCVLSNSLEQLLNDFYYFWSSGFSQYSNEPDLSKFNPMITTPAPGFLSSGPGKPINIASWTNIRDCQKSYFYNYCQAGSNCGPCLGPCSTGILPCENNDNFTPNNIQNVNPFTCTGNIKPPISFWEKWKDYIIGGIITVVILFVGITIAVVLAAGKKSKIGYNPDLDDNSAIIYK